MPNPFRSEAEMFRWVVAIGAGAAVVIVLTLLTEPVFGVVLGACLIGFGIGSLWGRWRARRQAGEGGAAETRGHVGGGGGEETGGPGGPAGRGDQH